MSFSSALSKLTVLLLLAALALTASAQEIMDDLPDTNGSESNAAVPMQLRVRRTAYEGDSIPYITVPTVYKYAPITFKSKKEEAAYNRLVKNVKDILPLAKTVRLTIIETYDYLQTLPDEKARKEHIQAVEKGIVKEYTPVVKKMTRSQGRLLIKLVDRECNMSGYNIAQAFIGSVKANFYQSISFIFNLNLNKKYDPEGDDRYTERVVRLVESGQI